MLNEYVKKTEKKITIWKSRKKIPVTQQLSAAFL